MNGVGVHSNGHSKNAKDFSVENGLEDIKQDIYGISDYSSRLESILFSLLKQHNSLKNKFEDFVNQSSQKERELEQKIDNNFANFSENLDKERKERESDNKQVRDKLNVELSNNGDELKKIEERLQEEIRNREDANKIIDDKFSRDVDIF